MAAQFEHAKQDLFDAELWQKCCEEEFVAFVSKTSQKYPLVLKRYRDSVKLRKTPEYIQKQLAITEQKEKEKQAYLELVNSEAYKKDQKAKSEAYKKKKEDEKKWLQKARESMSWGT
jgi:spore germination cell wall hydrolase CwlJ-like protein